MLTFNWKSTLGSNGFTLVELISVIVILALVSVIGSTFVLKSIALYDASQERYKLSQKARVVVEQLSRRMRVASPQSIRVSGTGNCIEYLPVIGASTYLADVPDEENNVAASTSVATVPFAIEGGTAQHVLIGASAASEIYTNASPSSRVSIGVLGVSPYSSVSFASVHRFKRNSVSRRIFITDQPIRYCIVGTNLFRYSNYGLDIATLNDLNPGGDSTLMTNIIDPASSSFALSAGSEDRNAAIDINLVLEEGGIRLAMPHQVLVRNVP